jgi:hypothetical protein
MDDVLDPGSLHRVQEILAPQKHVDRVAGDHKEPIDSLQGWSHGIRLIEIEIDHGNSQMRGLLGRT